MKSIIFTITMVFLIAYSAFTQTKSLSFKFTHTAGGQVMELNKTVFSIHNGKKVKLTRAEFYLSGVSLFTSDQDSINVADAYVLVNANNPDKIHNVGLFPADYNFAKLKMDVGIDYVKNHEDPNLYPPTHPLGPKSPDMHWGWVAGYRFIAIEGLVDNNNDGIPEQMFQIHSVGDALLFRSLLDMTASQYVETNPMVINLDYVKLFNSLSMSGNLIHHGSSATNKTVLQNAAKSGFLSPLIISSTENISFESIASFSQNSRSISVDFVNENIDKSVTIYNLAGQKIDHVNINSQKYNFDLSEVKSGNYIINIIEGNKSISKQFFVQ